MEIGKPPKMRIITGSAAKLEAQINLLLEQDYVPMERTWFVIKDEIVGVVAFLHMSEIRKAQMAAALHGQRN